MKEVDGNRHDKEIHGVLERLRVEATVGNHLDVVQHIANWYGPRHSMVLLATRHKPTK